MANSVLKLAASGGQLVRRLRAVAADSMSSRIDPFLRSEARGVLALVLLSLAAAVLPWLLQAHFAFAVPLSVLSFGLPAAALGNYGEDAGPPSFLAERRAPRPREIVIVGAGFSGTTLAARLALAPGLRVTLIERRDAPARGIAYGTGAAAHLLNVRAAKMSAFHGQDDHFQRWLAERGLGGADDFAPRRAYGAYLGDVLAEARTHAGGRLKLIHAGVTDVARGPGGVRIALDDGRRLAADTLVLALGNLPPATPPRLEGLPAPLYQPDPWRAGLAAGLGKDATVLLLGTGLTMIDAVLALDEAGFGGRIVALSRRGLLPRAHADGGHGAAPPAPPAFPAPLSALLAAVRRRGEEIGWRAAIDELRPVTQRMWRAASIEERARFLRHLRPWWDVHRHRVAPAIARRIVRLRESGRLQVHAGRILRAAAADDGIAIDWQPRGVAATRTLRADRLINCTGPAGLAGTGDPLLRRLLESGLARADPLGLGLEVTDAWQVRGAGGAVQEDIHAIGPIMRGLAWEITAVPDIRVQVDALAGRIIADTNVAATAAF